MSRLGRGALGLVLVLLAVGLLVWGPGLVGGAEDAADPTSTEQAGMPNDAPAGAPGRTGSTSARTTPADEGPARLQVSCDGEQVVEAPLQPSAEQAGAVWSPDPGTAEWWTADGWPPPGEPGEQAAVIGAHSQYDGAPDVFARLGQVGPGCEVHVRIDERDLVFEVVEAPMSVDKDEFTTAERYDRYWEPAEDGTWLTLVTCDEQAPRREDGHLADNVALRAVLVS